MEFVGLSLMSGKADLALEGARFRDGESGSVRPLLCSCVYVLQCLLEFVDVLCVGTDRVETLAHEV
jgi:hypothetical protein